MSIGHDVGRAVHNRLGRAEVFSPECPGPPQPYHSPSQSISVMTAALRPAAPVCPLACRLLRFFPPTYVSSSSAIPPPCPSRPDKGSCQDFVPFGQTAALDLSDQLIRRARIGTAPVQPCAMSLQFGEVPAQIFAGLLRPQEIWQMRSLPKIRLSSPRAPSAKRSFRFRVEPLDQLDPSAGIRHSTGSAERLQFLAPCR